MESLKKKVALVTGGSQGIGREIAEALAREECRVAVVCANHLGKAEEVAERIRKQGGIAFAERCDVSEEEEVRDLFRKLKEKEGGVDILVNNARLDPWKRKTEMGEGEWFDRVLGVNLKGAFLCSRELFEQAKEKKWHFCCSTGEQREALNEELYALKPFVGVIYLAGAKNEKDLLTNFTNILNVVAACDARKFPLTILFVDDNFNGKEKAVELLKANAPNVSFQKLPANQAEYESFIQSLLK